MKFRPLLVVTAFVVALGAGAAFALWLQLTIAFTAAAVVLLTVTWQRCPHRHATLLPPVRDAGPERDHARWYCDRCGATWAASFSTTTRPRLIYEGYDENKAIRAAARAETLERDRRRLALKRAGWSHAPVERATPVRSGPRPLEAVGLRRVRER